MTAPLFLIQPQDLTAASANQLFQLPPSARQHAFKAMRLSKDDLLEISDGAGNRLRAQVVNPQEGTVRIVSEQYEPQPSIKLGLVQALAKSGRDEQAIEMATEIGVDFILPWQADRSIVQWKGPKAARGLRKWQDQLIMATEQSRRSRIPRLNPLVASSGLEKWIRKEVDAGSQVLLLHQDADLSWSQVSLLETSPMISVIVGPEGGINDKEVEAFAAAGAKPVLLGHTILRASSAGPVALALLSGALGRF